LAAIFRAFGHVVRAGAVGKRAKGHAGRPVLRDRRGATAPPVT
jgi:hypothetical protein